MFTTSIRISKIHFMGLSVLFLFLGAVASRAQTTPVSKHYAQKLVEETRKEIESLPLDFRLGLAKCDSTPEQTFVLMRGSPQAPGDKVEPAFQNYSMMKHPSWARQKPTHPDAELFS